MKPRRNNLLLTTRNLFSAHGAAKGWILALPASVLLSFGNSAQAADRTWQTTGQAWGTASNWLGGIPGSADRALFNGTANPNAGTVGINLKSGTTNIIQAISLTLTSGSITIGNSETTGNSSTNFFQLNGTTVDSVANTILSNKTSSATTLTLQNNVLGGNKGMNVLLGNTTNVIQVSSGNTVSIGVVISQVNANSTLTLQGGGKLLLSAANGYTGLTTVSAGTLEYGISNAISTGAMTISGGTLDIKTFTDSVGAVTLSAGGTLKMAANQTGTAQLVSTGAVAFGSAVNTLDLTGMGTTAGIYKLVSGSSLTGTFGTITGLNSNYLLRYGTVTANQLDAQRKADQTLTLTTPASTPRALVSTNVSLSGTLTNTSPSGSSALAVALTSTGTLSVGSLASSTGSSVVVGTPSTITGSIATGLTAGTFGWNVRNTDANAITSPVNISGSINVVDQRSFTVVTPTIALGRFLIGATPAGTSAISSSGLNGVTANATLGAFNGTGTNGLTLGLSSGSNVFTGGSASQTANYSVGGTASGVGAISGSFSSAVTAELGSISNVNVAVTGTALNQRSFTVGTTPIALGRFLIGATPVGTSAISSSGLNGVTANASLGLFSTVSGLTLTTGDSTAFNGGSASQTANYSVVGTATAGAISGTFSSAVTAELGSISNVNVAVTGTAVATRTVNAPTTTALGNFHAGAAVSVTSNAFGYTYGVGGTGANSDTEDTTVLAYGGAPDANGITLSGGVNNINSASTFTRTFSGTAAISSSSGSFSSTVNPEFSAATSVSAGYTIGVYSGQMVWSGGSGTYATGSNWTDSVAGGAQNAPGLDAGFTGVDTATFNGSGGSVALGGSNPSLNKVTFGNSGNYTVTTTGGSITMAGTTPTITTTGGTHEISASIAGSNGLRKNGAGTLALSAANTYTGATIIQAGTLQLLTGGSLASSSIVVGDTGSVGAALDAIATGLSVASGQTLSGIGTINGNTTIQSGGFLAPGNSPGILTNLGDMTIDIGSTFQAEINGLTVGTGYDQLNVTGLSSTVTLAGLLSVTTGFSPTPGDLFFLIDNDGSSAISGVFSNAPIDGNTYTFGSQQYEISYFGEYDTVNSIYTFTGGNDVVLRAVPEPRAALLGGIGLLFLLRRRRNG